MTVEIDRRVASLPYQVRRRDQSGPRSIVEYARRGLLRRHAAARANLSRAGWTRLSRFDRRRAVAAGLARERGHKKCRASGSEEESPAGIGVNGHGLLALDLVHL